MMLRRGLTALRTFHTSRALLSEQTGTAGKWYEHLKLNFFIPSQTIFSDEIIDSVSIPAVGRNFAVQANSIPSVTELSPGVVTVRKSKESVYEYFVCGGFAFVHPNSVTDIAAVEAVPLDQLDHSKVLQLLESARKAVETTTDPVLKAEAEIQFKVYFHMDLALSYKKKSN